MGRTTNNFLLCLYSKLFPKCFVSENYWIKWRNTVSKGVTAVIQQGLSQSVKMYCDATFTVYWQSLFHSLVAMVLILRTWTIFFFHQPNAGTVYYTTSQHVAVHSTESFPNLITGACLNSVTCHMHDRAEYLTSRVTILYFHKEPLIPNIWTRTLLHQHNHFFSLTHSPTCNYWRIRCSMCGRYCSNRAAAVFNKHLKWLHMAFPVFFVILFFCACVWLQCWAIQGMKKLEFHTRLQGWWENSHVCGSQSDSSPLQVKT